MKTSKATPASQRLFGKYTVTPGPIEGSPCHLFTGAMTSGKRYPVMGVADNRIDYAYRVAWEAVNGPVPEGPAPDGSTRYELHHRCEQKACVNAEHIELLTCREHRALHAELRREQKVANQLKREYHLFLKQGKVAIQEIMSAGVMQTKLVNTSTNRFC